MSVYNKEGIVPIAQRLVGLGYDLLGSDGTARYVAAAGIPIENLNEVSRESLLEHRVVTLVPEVHAGLLALRKPEHLRQLLERSIRWISLVYVTFYPLEEAIAANLSFEKIVELTDIGGPTMIRSGAKGRRIVIPPNTHVEAVLDWIALGMPDEEDFLTQLQWQAEQAVAEYVQVSADYLLGQIKRFRPGLLLPGSVVNS